MTKVHICKQCGNEFRHKWNSTNVFCSRNCFQEYVRTHPGILRKAQQIRIEKTKLKCLSKIPMALSYQCVCEICGKPFETTHATKTCCSKECTHEKELKRQRDRNAAKFVPKVLVCKECGKRFATEYGKGNRVFCSYRCAQAYHNRQGVTNRTLKKRKALVDNDITLKKLSIRDCNICYLCGRPVDWNDYTVNAEGAFLVGPNYPSIDHIVPLAKGGRHEWDNVKLAHCRCNTLKSDKHLEEIWPETLPKLFTCRLHGNIAEKPI